MDITKAAHNEGIAHLNSRSGRRLWLSVALCSLLLVTVIVLSISIGSTFIPISSIYSALADYTPTRENLIIMNVRLPRTMVTVLIGANLGVAGAMMQAITRNPIASPSIFGINAGAAFAVVCMTMLIPGISPAWRVPGAFVGAFGAALLVFFLSLIIKWGKMDVKLVLIGVTVQTFLAVGTQSMLIFNESKAELLLFWLSGSVVGNHWQEVAVLAVWSGIGLIMGVALSRSLAILSLGDETARGLGQRVGLLRVAATTAVVILAGASVSIAGPIGFIGLIVPHIVRYLVGIDYRKVIVFSALLGALVLTLADVASRWINYPGETPVGIVTALLGTPFFIYLARRKGTRQ